MKTNFQGKSNTDPRMREIRRPNPTDDRPKSHSPSTKDPLTSNPDRMKKFDSTERKKFESSKLVDSFDRKSSKLVDSFDGKSSKLVDSFDGKSSKLVDSFDGNSSPPANCCSSKNGSWSSADSVQHYPERDTSGQVRRTTKCVESSKDEDGMNDLVCPPLPRKNIVKHWAHFEKRLSLTKSEVRPFPSQNVTLRLDSWPSSTITSETNWLENLKTKNFSDFLSLFILPRLYSHFFWIVMALLVSFSFS